MISFSVIFATILPFGFLFTNPTCSSFSNASRTGDLLIFKAFATSSSLNVLPGFKVILMILFSIILYTLSARDSVLIGLSVMIFREELFMFKHLSYVIFYYTVHRIRYIILQFIIFCQYFDLIIF